MSERFDERYELGIDEELPEEPEPPERHAAEPFALHGCVLTPDEKLEKGYVVVTGAAIDSVGTTKPSGVRIQETDGVILPGLIDLHGHPEYNVFAAWEPPQLFANRYRWRQSAVYAQVVKAPWN